MLATSDVHSKDRASKPARPQLPIRPRRMRFAFDKVEEPLFYEGNVLISTFVATLSGMFPPGEDEFVASVRNYIDQIDEPELLDQVRAFVRQEAHHADQHKRINRIFDALGLHATRVEEDLRAHIDSEIENATDAQRLASTVGMEHITAVLAHHLLTQPEALEPLPEPLQQLLRWHAAEEIEHKAVAFEVYQRCVGDPKLLRMVYLYTVVDFVRHVARSQRLMIAESTTSPTIRDYLGAARFFFGRHGMVTRAVPRLFGFFGKNFHPWDHDDSDLVRAWSKKASPSSNDLSAAA